MAGYPAGQESQLKDGLIAYLDVPPAAVNVTVLFSSASRRRLLETATLSVVVQAVDYTQAGQVQVRSGGGAQRRAVGRQTSRYTTTLVGSGRAAVSSGLSGAGHALCSLTPPLPPPRPRSPPQRCRSGWPTRRV